MCVVNGSLHATLVHVADPQLLLPLMWIGGHQLGIAKNGHVWKEVVYVPDMMVGAP